MRVFHILASLSLAVGASCWDYPEGTTQDGSLKACEDHYDSGRTNRYIIECGGGLSASSVAEKFNGDPSTNLRYSKEFDCSDIFSGLVLETDSGNADSLRAMPGVANVWPMESILIAPMPEQTPESLQKRTANYTAHRLTGVDRLHAEGIRGKGATVAIIDSGIDYTHRALGGCFGKGCKVSGGYDLVGQTRSSRKPDADPMDFIGHGTHVAGIIAADNEWLTGVAPDAKLLIYKVFADRSRRTDEELIIQGFCDAYKAGADVITASIGQPNGFVDRPWALVASRMVERGVVVTISAGNEGVVGPFFTGSGSNGDGVISVAAINDTTAPDVKAVGSKPVAAYFTSWGPTNNLLLKPDIGAPGYRIVSTTPGQNFATMSGTSMATPYIAGVAALYLGHHGGRARHGPGIAKVVSERIATSGQSVAWSTGRVRYDQTAPPFQVGNGLVDAWKVLHYQTQLSAEPFALLDTESSKLDWAARITNKGNRTTTYTFELEPQAGVELLDTRSGIKRLRDLTPQRIVPNVTLPRPVVVQPGQTKTAEFHFELPDVEDDLLPMYGGKIWFHGDNGEKLSVPYGGVAYDTEKEFDTMFTREPSVSGSRSKSKLAWSFNRDARLSDYVELGITLRYPCFHLRWDIFSQYYSESRWTLPTTPGKNGFVGSATTFRDAARYKWFDPTLMDKNDTVPFPLMRVPRGFDSYWWFGRLANGSYIAPGNYTMRFAALRPYGNPNISDHWDIMGGAAMYGVPFEVLPPSSNTPNPPARPAKPTSPTHSAKPTTPTQPAKPTSPTHSAKPTTPTQPAKPKPPTRPAKPTSPTQSAKPTIPTRPAKPTTPTRPVKPTSAMRPAKPTSPTQSAKPTTPTQPAKPKFPTRPAKPTSPTQSAKPTTPTPAVKPTIPTRPAKPTTPTQPAKPTN